MTENELRAHVLEECDKLKLKVLVIPDSRRLVAGAGFPDLLIAGPHKVVFRELKSEGGNLSREQQRWRVQLLAAGCDYGIWRPVHWPGVIRTELWHIAS